MTSPGEVSECHTGQRQEAAFSMEGATSDISLQPSFPRTHDHQIARESFKTLVSIYKMSFV